MGRCKPGIIMYPGWLNAPWEAARHIQIQSLHWVRMWSGTHSKKYIVTVLLWLEKALASGERKTMPLLCIIYINTNTHTFTWHTPSPAQWAQYHLTALALPDSCCTEVYRFTHCIHICQSAWIYMMPGVFLANAWMLQQPSCGGMVHLRYVQFLLFSTERRGLFQQLDWTNRP